MEPNVAPAQESPPSVVILGAFSTRFTFFSHHLCQALAGEFDAAPVSIRKPEGHNQAHHVADRIMHAHFVVIDLTPGPRDAKINGNVLHEFGIATTARTPVFAVCDLHDLPSNTTVESLLPSNIRQEVYTMNCEFTPAGVKQLGTDILTRFAHEHGGTLAKAKTRRARQVRQVDQLRKLRDQLYDSDEVPALLDPVLSLFVDRFNDYQRVLKGHATGHGGHPLEALVPIRGSEIVDRFFAGALFAYVLPTKGHYQTVSTMEFNGSLPENSEFWLGQLTLLGAGGSISRCFLLKCHPKDLSGDLKRVWTRHADLQKERDDCYHLGYTIVDESDYEKLRDTRMHDGGVHFGLFQGTDEPTVRVLQPKYVSVAEPGKDPRWKLMDLNRYFRKNESLLPPKFRSLMARLKDARRVVQIDWESGGRPDAASSESSP